MRVECVGSREGWREAGMEREREGGREGEREGRPGRSRRPGLPSLGAAAGHPERTTSRLKNNDQAEMWSCSEEGSH